MFRYDKAYTQKSKLEKFHVFDVDVMKYGVSWYKNFVQIKPVESS
jgi:hypothetical protein